MVQYLYSLACFVLPGTIWLIINRKKLAGKKYKIRHIIWSYIFILYCYTAIFDAAGIGTLWDLIAHGQIEGEINLIPFASEGVMTYVLNAMMFMPLGFLLPFIWSNYRKMYKVLLVGLTMSLTIELLQLLSPRVTDIDDLTMNVLGTLVGYFCWIMFKRIFSKAGEKAIQISTKEPLVYLFTGTLGLVLLYNWRILY